MSIICMRWKVLCSNSHSKKSCGIVQKSNATCSTSAGELETLPDPYLLQMKILTVHIRAKPTLINPFLYTSYLARSVISAQIRCLPRRFCPGSWPRSRLYQRVWLFWNMLCTPLETLESACWVLPESASTSDRKMRCLALSRIWWGARRAIINDVVTSYSRTLHTVIPLLWFSKAY